MREASHVDREAPLLFLFFGITTHKLVLKMVHYCRIAAALSFESSAHYGKQCTYGTYQDNNGNDKSVGCYGVRCDNMKKLRHFVLRFS